MQVDDEFLSLLTPQQREGIRQRLIRVVIAMLDVVARQHVARLANLLMQVQEIKVLEEQHIEQLKEIDHYDKAGFGNW